MAIVKLKYTRSRAKVKAHIRYITHRPSLEGKRQTRRLFTEAGQTDKNRAYQMVDEARRGSIFFKLVLSPDPRREDPNHTLDLWRLTRETLQALSQRLNIPLKFIGVEHADHTPNRHVHIVFSLSTRLSKEDIAALRSAATGASLTQVRERTALEQQARARPALGAAIYRPRVERKLTRPLRSFDTSSLYQLCPHCLVVTLALPLGDNLAKCLTCKQVSRLQANDLARQGVGWAL